MCRNGVRKAKACLRLNLGRDRKGNMKDFYRSINSKREIMEIKSLPLNGTGDLVTKDMEKDEVPNTIFTSAFTDKIYPEESQPLKTVGRSGATKFYAQLGGSHLGTLNQVVIHKSVGSVESSMRSKGAG